MKLLLDDCVSLIADAVLTPYWDSLRLTRAEAALDGMIIYGAESKEYCKALLFSEPSPENIAAALVFCDAVGDHGQMRHIFELSAECPVLWNAVRLGLRLSRFPKVRDVLTELMSSADAWSVVSVFDVILFHRLRTEIRICDTIEKGSAEMRSILIDALGRSDDKSHVSLVKHALGDTDPIVRRYALSAAARLGVPDLRRACEAKAEASPPCLSSVRFLGVLSTGNCGPLLRTLAAHDETAAAAIDAMGRSGLTELIPDILSAMANPPTANSAARALERITGRLVPRSDPPPPPDHLTEDELDFWFHPGDPIPEAAQKWWEQNQYYFEKGKRYQAGICVSDDPLGKHFDELPDEVRMDVYLRERALNPSTTPDWELETWPRYVRNPTWASQGL